MERIEELPLMDDCCADLRQSTLNFGKPQSEGVLRMRETAVRKRLASAENDLNAARQKRDRENRANKRGSFGRDRKQSRRAAEADSIDSDSDVRIYTHINNA